MRALLQPLLLEDGVLHEPLLPVQGLLVSQPLRPTDACMSTHACTCTTESATNKCTQPFRAGWHADRHTGRQAWHADRQTDGRQAGAGMLMANLPDGRQARSQRATSNIVNEDVTAAQAQLSQKRKLAAKGMRRRR